MSSLGKASIAMSVCDRRERIGGNGATDASNSATLMMIYEYNICDR